jgi:hypothetical protein
MLAMRFTHFYRAILQRIPVRSYILVLALALFAAGAVVPNAFSQSGAEEGDLGACTLHNHVYTCDAATFQKELSAATTVGLKTHNADGIAVNVLKDLVDKKLHKTIVPDGSPADLVFLLEPIDEGGQVETSSSLADLGTLRVYSATADGRPEHLLWAEVYSGDRDMSWPIVARRVVANFEKRFGIK